MYNISVTIGRLLAWSKGFYYLDASGRWEADDFLPFTTNVMLSWDIDITPRWVWTVTLGFDLGAFPWLAISCGGGNTQTEESIFTLSNSSQLIGLEVAAFTGSGNFCESPKT